MLRTVFAAVAFTGVLGFPSEFFAAQKVDKAEEQAKQLSEKFVKAFVMNKDLDGVMSLVAAPAILGLGDEPKVFRKVDDLKKQFAKILDKQLAKGPLEFLNPQTYEQFLAKEGDKLGADHRKLLDEVLKKTDRLLEVRVKSADKTTTHVFVMVGWRDGQPKIIGCNLAWSKE